MADKKLARVPLAQPGMDALSLAAPVIMQANPEGKWENKKPSSLDEERLKAVVQHLVNSKAISAAQTYCCQCALDNKNLGMKSNYVPVILMPVYPADQCPFDMECEVKKMKAQEKPTKKAKRTEKEKEEEDDDKEKTPKPKKRGFVLQRLTDFDLLSQW